MFKYSCIRETKKGECLMSIGSLKGVNFGSDKYAAKTQLNRKQTAKNSDNTNEQITKSSDSKNNKTLAIAGSIAGIAVVAGLGLWAVKRGKNPAKVLKDKSEVAKNAIKGTAEVVKDTAKGVADAVKKPAEVVADTIKEGTTGVANKLNAGQKTDLSVVDRINNSITGLSNHKRYTSADILSAKEAEQQAQQRLLEKAKEAGERWLNDPWIVQMRKELNAPKVVGPTDTNVAIEKALKAKQKQEALDTVAKMEENFKTIGRGHERFDANGNRIYKWKNPRYAKIQEDLEAVWPPIKK